MINTRHHRQEGAAMLIVMLVLLMSTSVATFAIHSATSEIRSTGGMVRAIETQQVAETGLNSVLAWIDQIGPKPILDAMNRSDQLILQPFEPNLAPGKRGYRIQSTDFASIQGVTAQPIDARVTGSQASLVAQRAFAPQFMVDITDDHIYTGIMPGERSDGFAKFTFMYATYTARGRTRVASDVAANGDYQVSGDARAFNEGATDARAYGISGPFSK